jgi:hypothetical protein
MGRGLESAVQPCSDVAMRVVRIDSKGGPCARSSLWSVEGLSSMIGRHMGGMPKVT